MMVTVVHLLVQPALPHVLKPVLLVLLIIQQAFHVQCCVFPAEIEKFQ